jgi:hypothetical protein
MSHVAKLSIAVVLALLAAGLNAMWLSAEKRPPTFTAVSINLPVGQKITDEALVSVPVPGDADKLRESLIPYSGRAILFGTAASRNYAAGDMVFQRDLQAPRELTKFEILGPFQLISVGERFKSPDGAVDPQASEGGNNVTIAVSATFDERTRCQRDPADRRGASRSEERAQGLR